jgi:hypothetical protein
MFFCVFPWLESCLGQDIRRKHRISADVVVAAADEFGRTFTGR